MTATSHAVIGTVIAAKIGNPAVAIPIALASHVIADLIPHWDTGVNRHKETKQRFFWNTVADVLIGVVICLAIIYFFFPTLAIHYALLIVIFASLPDILTAPYLFFDWKFPPFTWAYKIQKSFDNGEDSAFGRYGQIAIIAIVVIVGKLL